jgi:hypothetical protein
MERLFSACTRWHDIAESDLLSVPIEGLKELKLDDSTEELLSSERAFTYADLYAMLENEVTVAWFTPYAAVAHAEFFATNSSELLRDDYSFSCIADGQAIGAMAGCSGGLLEIFDVVLRLLAASEVHSVEIFKWSCPDDVAFSATSLTYLMEHCQRLKTLSLVNLKSLQEDQIRVLGTYSRPDLEIHLDRCEFTTSATSALAEVLKRNQGPTKLNCCDIDDSVLADGLRGNSRLKSLTPPLASRSDGDNREVLAIARALKENKGLVKLNLFAFTMSHETWEIVCDSLKTHPTLQFLHLRLLSGYTRTREAPWPAAELKSRIQALLDMLKENKSIQTIRVYDYISEHELFQRSAIPFLETNIFRPRVDAIQKTRSTAYRAKVLGRALLAVRTYPNRVWMLLSGNPEVAFPSQITTITTPTSLPIATTASATSNATVSTLSRSLP